MSRSRPRAPVALFAVLLSACGSEPVPQALPGAAPASVVSAPARATAARATTVGVRMAVLESITRIRGAAMTDAPKLQEIAQAVANEAAHGPLKWPEVLPALKARVKAARPIRGAFGVGATKVLDPKNINAGQMQYALEPNMKYLGLGVASGRTANGEQYHVVTYIAAEAMRTFGNDAADACIGAGMQVSGAPGAEQCCAGLIPVGTQQANADGTCGPVSAARVCAACGNGRCGNGENRCNCPKDCP